MKRRIKTGTLVKVPDGRGFTARIVIAPDRWDLSGYYWPLLRIAHYGWPTIIILP